MVDRDTKQLLQRCSDIIETISETHSILTEIDLVINEPDPKFEVPKEWIYKPDEVLPTEIRHPVEVSIAHEWVHRAEQLVYALAGANEEGTPNLVAALLGHVHEVYPTEIRHPVEVSQVDLWVDEAIRLANDYAHSFKNGDTMPRARAALYAHLNTVVELLK